MNGVRKKGNLRQVFAIPLAIALISLAGLISALIGDGPLDVTSWLALGLPIVIALWACLRRTA
jgi:hypothetical protein